MFLARVFSRLEQLVDSGESLESALLSALFYAINQEGQTVKSFVPAFCDNGSSVNPEFLDLA